MANECLEVLAIDAGQEPLERGKLRQARPSDVSRFSSVGRSGKINVFVGRIGQMLGGSGSGAFRRLRKRHRNKFVLLGKDLPPQALPEQLSRLHLSSPNRVHLVTSAKVWGQIIGRLSAAMQSGDPRRTIMDAWWEDDELVVVSPALERLRIPMSRVAVLARLSKSARESFEIDACGEYIHWPQGDVHLGWGQFEQAVDAGASLRARQSDRRFNRRYGAAIRQLREEKGLKQTAIPDLDRRQVIRIEQGQSRATHSALGKFASALGVGLNELLSELAERTEP